MNTVYMTVKITPPNDTAYDITVTGDTLEKCVEEIHQFVDTKPHGTRVYMLDCSNEGDRYEVTE